MRIRIETKEELTTEAIDHIVEHLKIMFSTDLFYNFKKIGNLLIINVESEEENEN